MTPYVIEAEVTASKTIINYELPADIPIGRVRLTIEPVRQPESGADELTREEVRERLRAAGLLSEVDYDLPPQFKRSDEAESKRLADLFGGGPLTSLDVINEDRGPY